MITYKCNIAGCTTRFCIQKKGGGGANTAPKNHFFSNSWWTKHTEMIKYKNICFRNSCRASCCQNCLLITFFFSFQDNIRLNHITENKSRVCGCEHMTTYLFSGAVAYESVYISQEKKEKKWQLCKEKAFHLAAQRKSVCLIIALGNFRPHRMTRESISPG